MNLILEGKKFFDFQNLKKGKSFLNIEIFVVAFMMLTPIFLLRNISFSLSIHHVNMIDKS